MRRRLPFGRPLGDALAYFAAASAAVGLTRFDGGVATLWVANALLIGRLLSTPRRRWAGILLASGLASFAATALFGVGLTGAVPLAFINIGEGALAAALLRRARMGDAPLQSLTWFVRFVGTVGVAAPAASATVGAGVVALVTGAPWSTNVANWFCGHALGNLTFTPITLLLLRGDVKQWRLMIDRQRLWETTGLLLLVLATSAGVFAQSTLPLLFLPLLPLILITFRIGRFGAAASVVVLALVGGALTLLGRGPISLMHGGTGAHLQFFQFYLAATVLTVLPVAADLARRNQLFRALRDSEARYRVLADTSTDIILNLEPDGRIRFVSPSIRQLGGYDPAELIGRNAAALVAPEHLERVRTAHLQALSAGGEPVSTEYLGMNRSGEVRWVETHARAIVTEAGSVDGIVSVVRDIEARKALEVRLAEEAMTDMVTGLPNRRAFEARLDRQLGTGGCVALFDLDHFKRVNDRWGHAAGDEVLRTFAAVARRTIRGGDLVARVGGEEFAVLLPEASPDQATLVCERLRAAFAGAATPFEGIALRVTTSGGVADIAQSREATLKAADTALYRAKAAGRDRLALAA